jgi:hypothetical protein
VILLWSVIHRVLDEMELEAAVGNTTATVFDGLAPALLLDRFRESALENFGLTQCAAGV